MLLSFQLGLGLSLKTWGKELQAVKGTVKASKWKWRSEKAAWGLKKLRDYHQCNYMARSCSNYLSVAVHFIAVIAKKNEALVPKPQNWPIINMNLPLKPGQRNHIIIITPFWVMLGGTEAGASKWGACLRSEGHKQEQLPSLSAKAEHLDWKPNTRKTAKEAMRA